MASQTRPKRVAVVGSGLAGLTTAYLLRRDGAEVWLIEKAPRLGFHAWSVAVGDTNQTHKSSKSRLPSLASSSPGAKQRQQGKRQSWSSDLFAQKTTQAPEITVDVPMRSFQGGYYPLLIALYKHLGLAMEPAHYSFSFTAFDCGPHQATGRPKEKTYFTYSGASGLSRPSLPEATWASPKSFVFGVLDLVVAAICYIVLLATAFLSWHSMLPAQLRTASFRDVVDAVAAIMERPWPVFRTILPPTPLGRAFKVFAADLVLPLFSAVGTMTAEDVWETPALHILDYIHAGVGTSHYSLANGHSARDVARLLSEPIAAQGEGHIRLNTVIRSLEFSHDNGQRVISLRLDGGDDLEVDRVVIATQASTARSLLGTIQPSLVFTGEAAEAHRVARMRSALDDVQYRDTIVVTHTDTDLLPRASDVRDINLFQPILSTLSADADPFNVPPLTPTGSSSSAPSSPCPTPGSLPQPLGAAPYFEPTRGSVYTMATQVVRKTDCPVLQTTNPVVPINPDAVLGMARLERALPLRNLHALDNLHQPQPVSKEPPLVYVAGSFAYPGIPLLEGCVGSARRVADEMRLAAQPAAQVNWQAGQGSLLGRVWRWRWTGRGGY